MREYDTNIVSHTKRLNEQRLLHGEEPVVWKYFQYLALLFTEVYLDRYFRDPAGLRSSLNEQIRKYNDGLTEELKSSRLEELDGAAPLNKLAFWMATGSGKTLLMHANILQ